MKKFKCCASPFIMLMFPIFLLIGLFAFNYNNEIPSERQHAILKLKVPTLKMIVNAVIR